MVTAGDGGHAARVGRDFAEVATRRKTQTPQLAIAMAGRA
jgi:hypothetical protein